MRRLKQNTSARNIANGADADEPTIAIDDVYPRTLALGGLAYLAVYALFYVFHFGADPQYLLCFSLMKLGHGCPGQSSDLEILRGLDQPFSFHVLPIVLFAALFWMTGAVIFSARRQDPELRFLFKMAIVANGFFYGYAITTLVLSELNGIRPFASGYLFALSSFLVIYLLYIVTFHLQSIMPNAAAYEVEYGFIFDSLFVALASSLVAYGFDSSVDIVRSGATFIVSAFAVMLLFDALFVSRMQRFLIAIEWADAHTTLRNTPVGFRARWPVFKEAWREVGELTRVELNEVMRANLRRESKSGPVRVSYPQFRGSLIFVIAATLVMPIAQYFIARLLIHLVLHWLGWH